MRDVDEEERKKRTEYTRLQLLLAVLPCCVLNSQFFLRVKFRRGEGIFPVKDRRGSIAPTSDRGARASLDRARSQAQERAVHHFCKRSTTTVTWWGKGIEVGCTE
jgi:hypothetical protein